MKEENRKTTKFSQKLAVLSGFRNVKSFSFLCFGNGNLLLQCQY